MNDDMKFYGGILFFALLFAILVYAGLSNQSSTPEPEATTQSEPAPSGLSPNEELRQQLQDPSKQ